MSWQILIGISIISYSVAIIVQRVILKKDNSDPVAYSIFTQLLIGTIIAVYGLLFADIQFPPDWHNHIFSLVLMTIFWASATLLTFKAMKSVDASTYTILYSSRALFTTLASSLVLNEILNSRQWIGMVLILIGIFVISYKKGGIKIGKYEIFVLIAAIFAGFGNTNDRLLLKSFSMYTFSAIVFIFPATLITMFNPKALKKISDFKDTELLKKILTLCVLFALAALTFFGALQKAPNSSQVAAIGLTPVVIIFILSVIFLKEKENFTRKLIGVITSLIGLLLMG